MGKPVNIQINVGQEIKNVPMRGDVSGGEGGIRTREPLRVTRAPGVRAKPDYATSPDLPDGQRRELYRIFCSWSLEMSNAGLLIFPGLVHRR